MEGQDLTFMKIITRGLCQYIKWPWKISPSSTGMTFGRKFFFIRAFQALKFNGIDGDYVEFGCWSCSTFFLAYKSSRQVKLFPRLWAFDSFSGLPSQQEEKDNHPQWKKGAMFTTIEEFHSLCKTRGIPRDEYTAIPGYYDKTIEHMSPKQPPTNICLVYIDCDMYSSARSVLKFLMPRLKHGMIIAFDNYYCWSATQISGERMAFLEYFRDNEHWSLLPYLQIGGHGLSFIVENKHLLRV